MNEYTDGTFGAIMPASDLLKNLVDHGIPEDLKAVHLGTPLELEEIRKKKHADIEALKDRVDNIERILRGEIIVVGESDLNKFLERHKSIIGKKIL